jgi:two-component system LytT family response regulator
MPDGAAISVVVVDDEPLGCRRLTRLLEKAPGVEVAGTAEDGPQAIEAIRALRPDLVFLDVQMPGLSGLDVVEAIGADAMPVTVFVTAYDEFAIRAFDVAAVDYLVKPFDNERFEQALGRALRQIELGRVERVQHQIRGLLDGSAAAEATGAPDGTRYLERIPVPMRGRTRVVPVSEIDYLTARGGYVEIRAGDAGHVIRDSLQSLEEQLEPGEFLRIHRSTIVRLSLIESLLRKPGGDYHVQLATGTTLKVSRYRRDELEARLGGAR